ncbi:MAG: amino acid ABC transporter ATP-binding protein [Clostridiales bacterium]|nr:amino acid ABC transporter ATP-binding protein [Clostridiales bacterium]
MKAKQPRLNEWSSTEVPSTRPLIQVKNLSKSFGEIKVLTNINECFYEGEVVSIIGPSGGGKSTLLRCLNLLEVPEEGQIFIDGVDITQKKVDITQVRQKIGMVFQQFHVFPHLTVLENITLTPILERKMLKAEAIDAAESLLNRVGLIDKRDEYPSRLSGGQKQRLAIVRALAMKPKIMLFDEPTSALDPEMVGEVLEVIRDLADSNMTILIVTHEIPFAREISNRILFVCDEEIYEQGSPDMLLDQPKRPKTRQFLNSIL